MDLCPVGTVKNNWYGKFQGKVLLGTVILRLQLFWVDIHRCCYFIQNGNTKINFA